MSDIDNQILDNDNKRTTALNKYFSKKEDIKLITNRLIKLGYILGEYEEYEDTNFDITSTNGKQPPQIKDEGKLGKINIINIITVQKRRYYKKLYKQFKRVREQDYAPITIDIKGRIINGHHRYDAFRILNIKYVSARMINDSIENIVKTKNSNKNHKSQLYTNKKYLSEHKNMSNFYLNTQISNLDLLKLKI